MKIRIEIDCDNAAFHDSHPIYLAEVSRMLREFVSLMDHEAARFTAYDGHTLRDFNGNTCGKVTVSD